MTTTSPRVASDAQMLKWPRHKCGLYLTHNQHKDYYKTVKEAIEDNDHGYCKDDFINEEQRKKSIDANECWTLQWYPDTPVGCYILSAYDLDLLIEEANKIV